MKFEEALTRLGEFGPFQKRIYLLLTFPAISIASLCVCVIVLLYTPEHRCKLPGVDNDTYAVQSLAHEALINESIPSTGDSTRPYDRCHLYDTTHAGLGIDNVPANASKQKCSEWVYDKSVFRETFTSKANFVCDDAMKTSHIQMLFYFGLLMGDIVLGMVSDRFGRKKGFYIGIVALVASAVSVTWAPGLISFAILHFIIGGSGHGAFVCIAVIGLELVGSSQRIWTGVLIQMTFATGICYVPAVASFLRHWQWINLACALPCVAYLTYWWLIPESPRWLLSQGRSHAADVIMKKIAKTNKTAVPKELLLEELNIGPKPPQKKIWHLLKSPVLARRISILSFNWLVISMTYYGTLMHAGELGGNYFLNFFLMAFAEIPGGVVGLYLMTRIGRRPTTCGALILGGACCLASVPTVVLGKPELQPLTITLAFLGKAGISAAFGIIYIYTAELLPTVVRTSAMGLCSCAARVGAMLAPYIAKSGEMIGGDFGKAEPMIVFGALSVIAGLLLFLLPETLHQKLPDTIEEGEQFGRFSKEDKARSVEILPMVEDKKTRFEEAERG